MPQKAVEANESHPLIHHGKTVDALTGDEWVLLECPSPACGHFMQAQNEPSQIKVLRHGPIGVTHSFSGIPVTMASDLGGSARVL